MQGKIIATAVGFAGWGALMSWAITADRWERQLKDANDTVDILRGKLREERNKPPRVVTITQEDLDAAQPVAQEIISAMDGESDPENPRGDVTSDVDEAGDDEAPEEPSEEEIEQRRSNLQELIDQYTIDTENRDDFVNKASEVINSNDPPFVIDQTTYAWDEEGENHEKTTVTYYPASRVVLDEDDEVIDDPGAVLGWRNLSRFGDESGNADVVFIRNRRLMTDYEVVRDEDSPLPLHVKYGLGREEFNVAKAAGTLRLRDEDQ